MTTPSTALADALAHLEHRWGSAVVRLDGSSSIGALEPDGAGVVPTGFPALDALLSRGGLAGEAQAVLRGGSTSGKTTLALRLIAEAQAQGAVAAYLDLGRTLDPLEAVARGVDLAWLLVLRAADATEGLRLAGALLSGRTVDLLVVDLPDRLAVRQEALLRRLAARARQVRARLVVLEPLDLAPALHGALAETSSLRLELERHGWIRVRGDVVGLRILVTVAKDRSGAPGRRAEIEILYVDEGERERGVAGVLDAGGRLPAWPVAARGARAAPGVTAGAAVSEVAAVGF